MHIYVCSTSKPITGPKEVEISYNHLVDFGHQVTYSKNMFSCTGNTGGTIEERVADLHEGFTNPQYDLVLSNNGGFNSNELLPHIDYNLIKSNSKPFCGYSDNTTLCTTLFQKAGIRSIYGLCYEYLRYSADASELVHFNDAITGNSQYYAGIQDRIFKDVKIFRKGHFKGKLIGGNFSVINWLIGTDYEMQIPEGSILFLEDDDESTGGYWQMYLRRFQMMGYFDRIAGLIIGKTPFTTFNDGAHMEDILNLVISGYDFPVVYDSHFGHLRDNTINNIELGLEVDREV